MKVYVAKYFENEKGLFLEGFRYKKVYDKKQSEFEGIYCRYYVKSGLYDSDSVKTQLLNRLPLNVEYVDDLKAYKIKNAD